MSEVYERDSVFFAYLKWHYGQGVRELVGVSQNFLWFVKHFFSFSLLLRTLFAPWKRMGESYGTGFDFRAFAPRLVNIIMRVFGFLSKTIILIIGFASYIFVFTLSLAVFFLWILAPALLLGSAILSVTFFAI